MFMTIAFIHQERYIYITLACVFLVQFRLILPIPSRFSRPWVVRSSAAWRSVAVILIETFPADRDQIIIE